MYQKLLLMVLCFVTIFFVAGCASSPVESTSSSVMGISADPNASSLYKLSVTPGSLTLGTEKSVPLVVQLTNFSGAPVKGAKITLASSLPGTFTDDDDDETDAGGYAYRLFTAGTNAGTTKILVSAFDAQATFSLQILPNVAQTPTVTVFTATEVVKPTETVFIQVFVADANGVPLDKTDVVLQTANGGTFADSTGTTSEGWYTTILTAGNLVGEETITAMALGKTGTKNISVRN